MLQLFDQLDGLARAIIEIKVIDLEAGTNHMNALFHRQVAVTIFDYTLVSKMRVCCDHFLLSVQGSVPR